MSEQKADSMANPNLAAGETKTVCLTLPNANSGPTILTGKPTVAPNTGSALPAKLLTSFQAAQNGQAEWIRLCAPGARCAISGLSRTSLNEAIERGDIRAITIRQPGATRGIKLINRASLLAWLVKLDAEQNGTKDENHA